jgi:hypothetical protein
MFMPLSLEKHCASYILMAYWSGLGGRGTEDKLLADDTGHEHISEIIGWHDHGYGLLVPTHYYFYQVQVFVMFYFQYVVNKVDINYSELKPTLTVNFNEMSSRL